MFEVTTHFVFGITFLKIANNSAISECNIIISQLLNPALIWNIENNYEYSFE